MDVRRPLGAAGRVGARGMRTAGRVGLRGAGRVGVMGFERFVAAPTAADLPAGRMVTLPDNRGATYVSTAGSDDATDPPLLLLHAIGTTAMLTWFSAVPTLSQSHRVVLFDMRWHGRGPRTSRVFRLSDLADDAVAVADVLGIEQFVPVGYSLGGTVAQLVWHRHPERVAGLVLAGTARNFRGTGRESTFFRMLPPLLLPMAISGPPSVKANALTTGLLEEYAGGSVADAEFRRWALTELGLTSRKATVSALSAMGRFNSAPWICDVDVPTSVVITAKDHCIPTRRQRKLADCIDGADVFEISGGHAAMVTHADEFATAVSAACDSVRARIRQASAGEVQHEGTRQLG